MLKKSKGAKDTCTPAPQLKTLGARPEFPPGKAPAAVMPAPRPKTMPEVVLEKARIMVDELHHELHEEHPRTVT